MSDFTTDTAPTVASSQSWTLNPDLILQSQRAVYVDPDITFGETYPVACLLVLFKHPEAAELVIRALDLHVCF
jgi:hypothetical protein